MANEHADTNWSNQPGTKLVALLASRPVVLIGLMGSGKTTIGELLAAELGLDFKDSDQEIVSATGMTIDDIFERNGEDFFRSLERQTIRQLLNQPTQVIATGGGVCLDRDTRAQIADKAVSIWLKADECLLIERVANSDSRPLLRTGDPKAIIKRLISQRYPLYSDAAIIVNISDAPVQQNVAMVIKALHDYLMPRSPAHPNHSGYA